MELAWATSWAEDGVNPRARDATIMPAMAIDTHTCRFMPPPSLDPLTRKLINNLYYSESNQKNLTKNRPIERVQSIIFTMHAPHGVDAG